MNIQGITTENIQATLDENAELIHACIEHQNLGRVAEAAEFYRRLHRNLTLLASLADATVKVCPFVLFETNPYVFCLHMRSNLKWLPRMPSYKLYIVFTGQLDTLR